jgi:predicted membrane channel-forming protein YqfA (hemolysin III family)
MVSHEDTHGQTQAAWIAVAVMLIGSMVSAVAVVIARPNFFWIGIGIVLVGGIVGALLRSAGLGQEASRRHIGGR